jgi:hypothetical protein
MVRPELATPHLVLVSEPVTSSRQGLHCVPKLARSTKKRKAKYEEAEGSTTKRKAKYEEAEGSTKKRKAKSEEAESVLTV